MDLLENMNGALSYIEENLSDGDIDFKEVAKRAFCSEYHFKRAYQFVIGFVVSYIQRTINLLAMECKMGQLMK